MINERGLKLPGSLASQMEGLWREQAATWPMLARGIDSLNQSGMRSLQVNGSRIMLQCNPARMASVSAAVDDASLADRPCFLCADNLPHEQRAMRYDQEWLILCNPVPVFDPHFTIVSKTHRPQRVQAALEVMLDLARDLEGAYTIFYNGPRCGASAPDHLHVQATPVGVMPFEMELARDLCYGNDHSTNRCIDWLRGGPTRVGTTRSNRRPAVVLIGESKEALLEALKGVIKVVGQNRPLKPEPMLNLFATFTEDRWVAWLFPRQAHRPHFYGTGPENFLVSPGCVDLGGLLIVPRQGDFDRLDLNTIQSIYDQVLLPPTEFADLRDKLAGL